VWDFISCCVRIFFWQFYLDFVFFLTKLFIYADFFVNFNWRTNERVFKLVGQVGEFHCMHYLKLSATLLATRRNAPNFLFTLGWCFISFKNISGIWEVLKKYQEFLWISGISNIFMNLLKVYHEFLKFLGNFQKFCEFSLVFMNIRSFRNFQEL
jgi:hypothetical protein